MRCAIAAVVMVGAIGIMPFAASAAAAGTPQTQSKGKAAKATAAGHATRGVVKSIDDSTMVIVRTGHRGEMTFALSPTIHHETIAAGTAVSVRYREEGTKHVATAITVSHATHKTAASAPAAR